MSTCQENITKEILEKYKDPQNTQSICSFLQSQTDEDFLIQSIKKVYPTWIKAIYDCYSIDYPKFQDNWEKLCLHMGATPKKIITVEVQFFDIAAYKPELANDYTLLHKAVEILVQRGYCIRRGDEFTGCIECNKAIPSASLHKFLIKNSIPAPTKWSCICSPCKKAIE